jgi:large repetitive protein
MRHEPKPERSLHRRRHPFLALVGWLGVTAFVSLALAHLTGADAAVLSRSARAAAEPPPVNARPPSISGAAAEGQLLRATTGRWRHALHAKLTYTWQRCTASGTACTDIPSATDSIHALESADVGSTVRVVVSATTSAGSASALSRRTPTVASAPQGAPVNTVSPTIAGTTTTGRTLTADPGTWLGKPDLVRYAWRRCGEAGGACSPTGRTSQSYVLHRMDAGHTLRVLVTEANSVATSAALSAPTGVVGPVTAPPAVAPKNVSRPSISGAPQVGRTLVASSGSWSGTTPLSYSFAWMRCRAGGAGCAVVLRGPRTYSLAAADAGRSLRVLVTAKNAAGSSSSLSRATGEVRGPTVATKPDNRGEPRISGTPEVGRVLTATTGTWSGTAPIAYAYRWRRCNGAGRPDASDCAPIGNATSAAYTVQPSDVGHRLRVQVTASNRAGSAAAASNATDTITWGKPLSSVAPAITGTATPGKALIATRGTWSGKQPITFGFQWLRCTAGNGDDCVEIAGMTAAQYVVSSADVGKSLRVRVTARNDGGTQSVVSSFRNVTGTSAPPPSGGVIVLRSGEKSIPAASVPSTARLIVSEVVFAPRPVRSANDPITVRVRVKDTRGFVVRDAIVFIRSTPRVTSGGNGVRTATDGWVTYQLVPNRHFPRPRAGFHVQFFVKAYRAGDPALAGVAGYRLVQVPLGV